LRFADHDERIPGTYVHEGTTPANSTWAMNPIPMCCPNNAPCTVLGSWTDLCAGRSVSVLLGFKPGVGLKPGRACDACHQCSGRVHG
jgi:hypothetical protein